MLVLIAGHQCTSFNTRHKLFHFLKSCQFTEWCNIQVLNYKIQQLRLSPFYGAPIVSNVWFSETLIWQFFKPRKASVRSRPNVLWCYKKELGFSTHRKKRKKMLEKKMKDGSAADLSGVNDPFELFICGTEIRWTYYKDKGLQITPVLNIFYRLWS